MNIENMASNRDRAEADLCAAQIHFIQGLFVEFQIGFGRGVTFVKQALTRPALTIGPLRDLGIELKDSAAESGESLVAACNAWFDANEMARAKAIDQGLKEMEASGKRADETLSRINEDLEGMANGPSTSAG